MNTHSKCRYGAKSVESRRTDVVPGRSTQGPPKRSGGTLSCHRGTRMEDTRLTATGTTPTAEVKILQWNAEGLQHKKQALTTVLNREKIDIACIQETHLNERIRFSMRGYQCFRKDRKERHKGGIITLVKNDIAANEVETDENIEMQGIKFAKTKLQYTLFNCYCPPTEPLKLETIALQDEKCIVVGDFNSHSPSWGYQNLDARGEEVENWITENKLQLIYDEESPDTFFSRAWKTTSNPDLIFVTEDLVSQTTREVNDQLAGSDHRPVSVRINEELTHTENSTVPRWNYKKANWGKFSNLTDTMTKNIKCRSKKIDKSAKEFTDAVLKAAIESIPRGARKHYIPGWSQELEALNEDVTKCRENVERNPTEQNIVAYKASEARLKRKTIMTTRAAWQEKTGSLDFDKEGRKLWKLTKALNGENNKYAAPAVENNEGKILNQKQSANCFMKQYKKIGEIEVDKHRQREVKREVNEHEEQTQAADELMTIPITQEEIDEAIKKLKPNKSPGPDELTNEKLTHLGQSAKRKLKHLFNTSWKIGRLPQSWKQANMIPIRKEGKPANKAESYRPISLTSCLGKLIERIINSRLMWYLESNHLLMDEQAGFRQYRSTEDQITYISQHVEDAFQAKKQTVVVWVDMEKAFDKVWTTGLLLKLKRAKITHKMFAWIKNYLTNRKARVVTRGYKSRQESLKNGVPQGGVLSPTLFLLFIDDI